MFLITERSLEKAMKRATSYDEWKEAALRYDTKMGLDRWKRMDQSRRYDYVSIRTRLDRLRAMRARHDNSGLLFNLNEGIHGNMGGMGSKDLYNKAKFGTKQLVVDYVDEIVDALEYLASPKVNDISFEKKLDFFRRAHQCFGSSALMMSGSGSYLYFHLGVVKTLWKHNLLPNVLSGSSGGAYVGTFIATHSDSELEKLFNPEYLAYEVRREDTWLNYLSKYVPQTMKIDEIKELLNRLVPDVTFQEAYEKTGRMMNISVAAMETHQKSRLLNAITSPNVYMREAILASAAVPGVYPPVTLAAKNDHGERQAYLPSRRWVDGSVSDDLPAKRLARLYGVNHYIVSQANPHVVPFISDSKRNPKVLSQIKYAAMETARLWFNTGIGIMDRPLSNNPKLSRLSSMALSIMNQDYVGDINILPESKMFNPYKVLSHLPEKEIEKLILSGEKATWPKLEMVREQSKIGLILTKILADYEKEYAGKMGSRLMSA